MFGEHASFIIPSYAISFVALVAATIIIRYTYSKRLAELKALEEQGAKRRSEKSATDG